MDQREPHVRSLGICYRIYHFIVKTLMSQVSKTVTLGRPVQFGSAKVQTCREDEAVVKPETKEQKAREKNGAGMNMNGEEKTVPPREAPKKTVSINDNVEEITDSKKKKKKNRSKSFQKSNSLERQQQEEQEDIKPLRPILKVRSNLDEKSIS
ncbi:uncharacterized protein LOC114740502 [Neltuma alba]|uniref:uncharacterized protein LOC114740502 n=1 Tax=Neltuma alba TaxID=207710 RepID=UPI0010A34833|nr:uncharacterized protein LOC114740502 [Prosopis alba]